MNKIYRLVWSREKQVLVVASEYASSRGVGGPSAASPRRLASLMLAGVPMLLACTSAIAGSLDGGTASGAGAIAIGSGSRATGSDNASGRHAIAIGSGAVASHNNGAFAVGAATATGAGSISIGMFGTFTAKSTASGADAMAIGNGTNATAQAATALGVSASASSTFATAVGGNSTASGANASAFGRNAKALFTDTVAIGQGARAGSANAGASAIAVGAASSATATNAVALGRGASATNAGAIALGTSSVTAAAVATTSGTIAGTSYSYAGTAPASTLSIGSTGNERTLTNLAAGRISTTSTDAVNGSQLNATNTEVTALDGRVDNLGSNVAARLGGGSTYDSATGKVSAPSYSVGGSTVDNVGDALKNLDDRSTTNTNNIAGNTAALNHIANGGGIKYFHASSSKADSSATGTDSVAVGPAAAASAANAIAIGNGATASHADSVALGNGAKTSAAVSTASGTIAGTSYAYAGTSPTSTVSLGADEIAATGGKPAVAAINRTLTHVAAGRVSATSTDAINGSQLHATNTELTALDGRADKLGGDLAQHLGGGAAYDPATGTVSAPSYGVDGKQVGNVGDALSNLDGRVTGNTDAIAELGEQIASGSTGLVQVGSDGKDGEDAKPVVTVGKDVGGDKIDLTGTEGPRVLTGVADGAVAKDSKDAINGSQLHDNAQSVADAFGGGAKVNADGTISAPSYSVGGEQVDNVGDAVSALDGAVAGNTDAIAGNTAAIAGNTTAITQLGDQINSGSVGLVQAQRDAKGKVEQITVAKDIGGGTVDFTGTDGERVLTGLADGAVAKDSKDAINGSQLHDNAQSVADAFGGGAKVNADGTISAPSYSVGGEQVDNVGDAVSALDGAVAGNTDAIAGNTAAIAGNTTAITQLGDQINSGSVGLVQAQRDAKGKVEQITVAKDIGGGTVDFTGTDGERVLTGLAGGNVAEGSNDAITGGQLHAGNQSLADALGGGAKVNEDGTVSAPSYSVGGEQVDSVGDAVSALDDAVAGNTAAIVDNATAINNIANGGGIKYFHANSTKADSTATGTDSIAVGPLANASAVNAIAIGNGATASHADSVALGNGARTAAAVATASGTIAGTRYEYAGTSPNGTVSFGREAVAATADTPAVAAINRTLTHVAAGRVSATSTDAINGSQLHATHTELSALDGRADKLGGDLAQHLGGGAAYDPATGTVSAPSYGVGGETIDNVGDAVSALDGAVAGNTDAIAGNTTAITELGDQVNSGSVGLVQAQRDAEGKVEQISVAKDIGGDKVDFTGTDGDRVLTGLAGGNVAEGSKDAITGGQLHAGNQSLADALGGGAKVNEDGTVSAPSYSVGGKEVTSVGDAVTGLDGAITDLGQQLNNGSTGLVKAERGEKGADGQDGKVEALTVGKELGGDTVDFTGTEGPRVLTGVAGGNVAEGSKDAINGGQLHDNAQSVADAFGGGAKVNADGTISAPSYSVGGETVDNVGDAVSALDGAVAGNTEAIAGNTAAIAGNTTAITQLGDQINSGSVGLVQAQRDAEGKVEQISVAKDIGGNKVDFTGTDGDRVLTGLAGGSVASGSKDAINGDQLHAGNQSLADALGGGAKVNEDGTVSAPSYTVGGEQVDNVGDALGNLDGRVDDNRRDIGVLDNLLSGAADRITEHTAVLDHIANGGGIKYFHANSTKADSAATGTDSIAVGPQATASATNAIAMGLGADAAHAGAVALGAGSKTATAVATSSGTIAGTSYAYAGTSPTSTVSLGADEIAATGGKPAVAAINRTLTHVAAGRVSATSTDAINGSQLHATNTELTALDGRADKLGGDLAQHLGGGAAYDPATGTVSAPSYGVDGKQVGNVGDALSNLDGRVTGNTDAIAELGEQIASGSTGLVQVGNDGKDGEDGEDGEDAKPVITVGKDVGGDKIDLTGTEGPRVLTGVADGNVAEGSKDAINGGQLHDNAQSVADALGGGAKVNADGTISAPSYTVGGETVDNVGDAVSALDGAVASNTEAIEGNTAAIAGNTTAITQLGDQINSGSVGLVQAQRDTESKVEQISVAKDIGGDKVDFTGTDGDRVLTGLANGAVAEGSKDAITGGQLHAGNQSLADALGGGAKVNEDGTVSAPSYSVGGKEVTSVGDAVKGLDGAITDLGQQLNDGSTGLVQAERGEKGADGQDGKVETLTVGKELGGDTVDFTGTDGDRVLTGVAGGNVAGDSKDAINGGQLHDNAQSVADAFGGGAKVNADGTISAPSYSVGGETVDNVGDAVSALDDAVAGNTEAIAGNTSAINNIANGGGIKYFHANSTQGDSVASGANSVAIGPMAVATAANSVALGQGARADRANTISVGSATAQRQVVNMAKGTQDTDAVNVSQLKGVASGLGGGAAIGEGGSIKAPSYTIGGDKHDNVGDALTSMDDRVNAIANGHGPGAGLVRVEKGAPGKDGQDGKVEAITIGKGVGGGSVDFTGTEGPRVITGVADGQVAEGSKDAVTGSQLHGHAQSVAEAFGGGAKVNEDGTISAPTYTVAGKDTHSTGEAIREIDKQLADNASTLQDLAASGGTKYFQADGSEDAEAASATGNGAVAVGSGAKAPGNGSTALGQGAQASGEGSVALGSGSVADKPNTVAVGSAGNERTISHVAAGKDDTDAANMGQLREAQAGTVGYDRPAPGAAPDYGSVTLGGPGGTRTTVVRNVANGSAPNDAVNVGQLQSGMAQTLERANAHTDGRFDELKQDAWVAKREARSGTAAAMAMAGMPQAYLPGKSMLAAAVGGYQGEAALAVGLSGVTDNGRYVYKAQASGNSRGDFGFSVGAGIQW